MNAVPAPISVVIPCYKCEDTVERALLSVINQTKAVSEIILVDDFSEDKTLDKLYALQAKHSQFKIIVVEQQFNCGPGIARNAGWNIATEPWIAFLDADDSWDLRKIELQYSWVEKNREIDFISHDTGLWESDANLGLDEEGLPIRINSYSNLFRNIIPTRSVLIKSSIPFRFLGKDYAEDYLLWLTLLFNGYSCFRLPLVLAYSHREEYSLGGYSGSLWRHEKRELKCFFYLYQRQIITLMIYVPAVIFSIIKYLKRTIFNKIKSWK